jgi:acetyl-CoA carboxylase biotin carboxyl carrier protein
MATVKKTTTKKAVPKKAVSSKIISAPVSKTVSSKKETVKPQSGNNPNPIFNIDEINQLLKAVNHSNVNELKLEKGDFKITIRQGGTAASAPAVSAPATPVMQATQVAASVATPIAAVASAPVVENTSENLITIKSPMIGTFYRSSGPDKPLFVNVGDEIKVGQVLCIVEAMKLFNEIESEVSGRIVKVLIDDTTPVEYDQPLFLVQP